MVGTLRFAHPAALMRRMAGRPSEIVVTGLDPVIHLLRKNLL
jgi:hypothetical protein